MRLDHVGMLVSDLEAAISWYQSQFGCEVARRETDTDVDDVSIGLPGEAVRLRGAVLWAGGCYLELHQYLSPPARDHAACAIPVSGTSHSSVTPSKGTFSG